MTNLATALVDMAERHPQRIAVRDEARALTYAELDEFSARAAGGLLAHGVRPGDKVGLKLAGSTTLAALFLAALRVGAIAVPLRPKARSRAVQPRDDACGARIVFASPDPTPLQQSRAGDTMLIPVGADFLDQLVFWPQHPVVLHRADNDVAVLIYEEPAPDARHAVLSHGWVREAASTARFPYNMGGDDAIAVEFSIADPTYGQDAMIRSAACLTGAGTPAAAAPRERGNCPPQHRLP